MVLETSFCSKFTTESFQIFTFANLISISKSFSDFIQSADDHKLIFESFPYLSSPFLLSEKLASHGISKETLPFSTIIV